MAEDTAREARERRERLEERAREEARLDPREDKLPARVAHDGTSHTGGNRS
jgi:hypothetical protein